MNPTLQTTTAAIDPVFVFIFGVCLVLLVGITGVTLWFVVRYHRSRSPRPTSSTDGNLWLEIVWTALPTVVVLAMFYYGWAGYLTLRNVPKGAMEVKATGRMWSWLFTYASGRTSTKLYVPVGKPVKVELVSDDVIHGFYVPAFRIKRDVVPGMTNQVWFVADRPGSYDLFCSQYCGTGHSAMITTVEALPEKEFGKWLEQRPAGKVERGKTLLENNGCLGCHTLDGTISIGPSFKGIWGRTESVITGGRERTIVVEKEYLIRAIRVPKADVVKGFPPVMQPYDLPQEELAEILEYLKGLK